MSKILAGSPAAKRDAELTEEALALIGQEMLASAVVSPFKIPTASEKVIDRARSLNHSRDEGEVELSALLHKLDEERTYIQYGCTNLAEFAENHLDISGSKARALSGHWRQFLGLGLKPEVLSGQEGVSFTKFKLILGCVNKNIISKENVSSWLPLLKKEGSGSISRQAIEGRVRQIVADHGGAGDEEESKIVRVSIAIRRDLMGAFQHLVETYKEATGAAGDGEAIFDGMNRAAASVIGQAPGQCAIGGVVSLVNAIARLTEATPLIFSADPSITIDTVGVPVVSSLYVVCYPDTGTKFCLAPDLSAAAVHFGVPEARVEACALTLSSGLRPEARPERDFNADSRETTEASPEVSPVIEEDPATRVYTGPSVVTEADIDKNIVFTIFDKTTKTTTTMDGQVASVRADRGLVYVKGHRGRPKAVPFEHVVSMSAPAPIAEKKKPGRKPKDEETKTPEHTFTQTEVSELMSQLQAELKTKVTNITAAGGDPSAFTTTLRALMRKEKSLNMQFGSVVAEGRATRAGLTFVRTETT